MEWISVNDRLPIPTNLVLIKAGDGYRQEDCDIFVACIDEEKRWIVNAWCSCDSIIDNVIEWCEIPD